MRPRDHNGWRAAPRPLTSVGRIDAVVLGAALARATGAEALLVGSGRVGTRRLCRRSFSSPGRGELLMSNRLGVPYRSSHMWAAPPTPRSDSSSASPPREPRLILDGDRLVLRLDIDGCTNEATVDLCDGFLEVDTGTVGMALPLPPGIHSDEIEAMLHGRALEVSVPWSARTLPVASIKATRVPRPRSGSARSSSHRA